MNIVISVEIESVVVTATGIVDVVADVAAAVAVAEVLTGIIEEEIADVAASEIWGLHGHQTDAV